MHNTKSLEEYVSDIQQKIQTKNYSGALNSINEALKTYPSNPKLYINGGNIYKYFGDLVNAEKYFSLALSYHKSKEAYNNLSVIFLEQNLVSKAIEYARYAVNLDQTYIDGNYNLGLALEREGNYDEALLYAKKVSSLDENNCRAWVLLYRICQNICNWESIDELKLKLDKFIGDGIEHPFLNISRDDSEANNYKIAKAWGGNGNLKELDVKINKLISSSDKIRLGYICGEMKNHPTYHLIKNLFKHHNSDMFDIFIFSYDHDKECFDNLKNEKYEIIDINNCDDEESIKKICDFNLDILIDLSILISNNKQRIIKSRPAKKIISYLGYPGTSGLSCYDYIITDKIVTPESQQKYYTEKFLYLSKSYQVNDGVKPTIKNAKKSDFDLPDKSILLGSFNQAFKITQDVFNVWLKILSSIPHSYLWILEDNRFAKDNLINYVKKSGLDVQKLIFAPRISRQLHLERISLCNVALDTTIYNGHTTTIDLIQSLVPVVTLEGNHFASRVSSSLLKSLGLDELVTKNLDDYQKKVIQVCTDESYAKIIKDKLLDETISSNLFDLEYFTKDLEMKLLSIFKN